MNSFLADLHIHSRFANATSPQLTIENIGLWGMKKGIQLIGTGDFTHPVYLQEVKDNLHYNPDTCLFDHPSAPGISFVLTTEVSCIYKDNGKSKKIHMLLIAPSFLIVDKINAYLARFGSLASDGRPILLLSAKQLIKDISEIDEQIEIIPAHIWTPWFGVLGQRFGYDSLESCFGKEIKHIHAIETGLSSDPLMNWLIFSKEMSIVSFSDAHSLQKIGREATAFCGKCTYENLIKALRTNAISYTIEFFPEEGKYHYSGHRKCRVSLDPKEAMQANNRCPVCGKKVTEGVLKRVFDIAQRTKSLAEIEAIVSQTKLLHGMYSYADRAPFYKFVSLDTLLARVFNVKSEKSVKVIAAYEKILTRYGEEISILQNPPEAMKETFPNLYKYILAVNKGNVQIAPGYDNTYGIVSFSRE